MKGLSATKGSPKEMPLDPMVFPVDSRQPQTTSLSDSVMKLYSYMHRIRNTDAEYSCAASWPPGRTPHPPAGAPEGSAGAAGRRSAHPAWTYRVGD
eukprot:SAG22_NODE_380_length_11402_cov_8.514154_9_plen_96_part_00